jgi:hypothetical protein
MLDIETKEGSFWISGDLCVVIIDRTTRQETDADLLLPMR